MWEIQHDPAVDRGLVIRAQGGDVDALDQLIRRHQPWLLHVAQRMLWDRADAEDATQEILIKAITRLSGFESRADFRTWLYRIAANHVVDRCRATKSFQGLARSLSDMPDTELPETGPGSVERALLLEETKIACTTGMLLCLKPRQRLAFILGEILGLDDQVGSTVLDTTPGNFRQLLSRARGALYTFMNRRCGLVNQRNPCRCANKAAGFVDRGWVHTAQLQFVDKRMLAVQRVARDRMHDLQDLERRHALIFREQPLLTPRREAAAVIELLRDSEIRRRLECDR
jgi:RNA polymerase sigma factor (sigma-70 family)